MTTSAIAPMDLGGIFDRLFKLVASTWVRNLIIAAVILVLPVVIMAFSLDSFFSSIVDMAKEQEHGEESVSRGMFMMFGHMAMFGFGLFVFLLATSASTLGVTIISCAEMLGERMEWREALRRTFGIRYARVIGEHILVGFAVVGLVIVPYILIFAAIAMGSVKFGLLAGLLLVACACFAVYVAIRWSFAVPAIAWEDAGILAALRRSWSLVRDNWWRIFGILLLMSIVTSFAVSLVLTPVYIAALWNFFAAFFERIGSMQQEHTDPTVFLEAFRSFGFGMGVISGLSSLLQMLVSPLYVVILYFDLRARKGEFNASPSQDSIPA